MRTNQGVTEIIMLRDHHNRKTMSISAITLEIVTALIGTLPLLAPRSTGAGIRALEQDIITKLATMTCHQLREHGYIEIVNK